MKQDYLIRGIEKNGKFKFAAVNTTGILEIAKTKHETSATASAALGRTISAAALMTTFLKNEKDILTLVIVGDGPAGKLLVTVNYNGEIKGYMDNPSADAPLNDNNKLNVSGIVGKYGYVKTIMDLGLKEPYTGQSEIITGEIAEDIANYYLASEQVNTAVALGVLVDKDLSILNSGGYIIQLLPGADEEDINKLEQSIGSKKSLTELMTKYDKMEEVIAYILEDFEIDILETKNLEWKCNCSREKTIEMLKSIGEEELTAIIEEDEKAEVVCHFCNEKYNFNKDELVEILDEIKKITPIKV